MPFEPTVGTWSFGFLPPNFNADVQVFSSNNNAQGAQLWVKPPGVTMCYMVAIGGGGGGGGGATRATTLAKGGGAGGACSGVSKLVMPAIFLPDALSVQVGNGGAGGGAGSNGGAGTDSIISYGGGVTALATIPNVILKSNNAPPGGGTAGSTSGNATGGSVPTIYTTVLMGAAFSYSIPAFIVGVVGATGGSPTTAGTSITAVWNLIALSPGTGGGGCTSSNTGFAGGNLTLQAALDYADGSIPAAALVGGTAGGAAAAGNGNSGIQLWKPFYMTGGTGGGSADNNTGGNGGNGAIGCGGGGGGAGTTGGTGGNGGNGIVVIISW